MDAPLVSAARVARAAEALPPADETFAALMTEPGTRGLLVDAPFLRDHELWRFERFSPRRPVIFYLATGPSGTRILTAHADAWNALVQADGGEISDEAAALTATRRYVEATRVQTTRFLVVEDVDALPWRPGLEPDDAARRDAATARYRDELDASARASNGGFEVSMAAVVGMHLARCAWVVGRDGAVVEGEAVVLESNLPFTWTL